MGRASSARQRVREECLCVCGEDTRGNREGGDAIEREKEIRLRTTESRRHGWVRRIVAQDYSHGAFAEAETAR